MYVKGKDGRYEVKAPLGSAWFSEETFKAGYKALKDTGVDPESDPMALILACSKEADKSLIPNARLIADLIIAGIGSEDIG